MEPVEEVWPSHIQFPSHEKSLVVQDFMPEQKKAFIKIHNNRNNAVHEFQLTQILGRLKVYNNYLYLYPSLENPTHYALAFNYVEPLRMFAEGDETAKDLHEFINILSQKKNSAQYNNKFKLELLLKIGKEIEKLHDKNCIHRDIKPENILLLRENETITPVLIDFELSEFNVQQTITSSEILGTYRYMAPEIVEKRKYHKYTDVYAFAMLMYGLFAEKDPYYLETAEYQIIKEKANGRVPEWPNQGVLSHLKGTYMDMSTYKGHHRGTIKQHLTEMEKILHDYSIELSQPFENVEENSPSMSDFNRSSSLFVDKYVTNTNNTPKIIVGTLFFLLFLGASYLWFSFGLKEKLQPVFQTVSAQLDSFFPPLFSFTAVDVSNVHPQSAELYWKVSMTSAFIHAYNATYFVKITTPKGAFKEYNTNNSSIVISELTTSQRYNATVYLRVGKIIVWEVNKTASFETTVPIPCKTNVYFKEYKNMITASINLGHIGDVGVQTNITLLKDNFQLVTVSNSTNVFDVEFKNLQSDTEYVVSVMFFKPYVELSKYGSYEYKLFTISTLQPSAPSPPKFKNITPKLNQILLQWDSPIDDGGSPISNYSIKYQLENTNRYTEYEFGSDIFNYTLQQLELNAAYIIQLSAKNSKGISHPTTHLIKLNPTAPLEPTNVRVYNITFHSAIVEWDASISGGSPIFNYTLLLQQRNNQTLHVVETLNTSLVLTELTPNTTYFAQLFCSNLVGNSTFFKFSFDTRKPVAPDAIQQLTISQEKSMDSVRLEWAPPISNGGAKIISYMINEFNNASNEYEVPGNCTSFTISNLEPGSYKFSVSAKNAAGVSTAESITVEIFDHKTSSIWTNATTTLIRIFKLIIYVLQNTDVLIMAVCLAYVSFIFFMCHLSKHAYNKIESSSNKSKRHANINFRW